MLRFIYLLFLISITQMTLGQSKWASTSKDDQMVSHSLITPFIDTDYLTQSSKFAKAHNTYLLDDTAIEQLSNNTKESILISIPRQGNFDKLLLRKANVVSETYRLKTSSGINRALTSDISTYRGIVLNTDYKAVLTVADGRLYFLIQTQDGNYEINPTNDGTYIGHHSKDITRPKNWTCETTDNHRDDTTPTATTRTGDCIEVYLECDFTTYTDNGSDVTNTEAWVINLMNSVDMLYDDIDVPLVVSEIFVWDTADPYQSSTTLTEVRNAFMDEVQDSYNGRIAKLLTTRPIGGGISNGIGGLCGSYGDFPSPYAISTALDPTNATFPNYSYNVYVIAHEIGHVIGARHTHACIWNGNATQIDDCGNIYADENNNTPEGLSCYDAANPVLPASGTIMSNCNLLPATGIDFANGFHPQVASVLQDAYIDADCSTGTVCFTEFPSNDDCLGAIDLTVYDVCNVSIFDTYLATPSGTLPLFKCTSQPILNDVWFRVKVPDSGTLTLETTDDGSLDNMIMQVYSGPCDDLTTVSCDEDSGTGNQALAILTDLVPCEYLYIRIVESDSDQEGTFGLCAYDASVACHPDYDALISIYNESNGSSWTNNMGWSDGASGNACDICDWYGVVCDGFGRVKELNLGNNNLTGSLSSAIGDLTTIKRINIPTHSMSGAIPNVFSDLDRLLYFDLSGGSFTGSIPDFTGLITLQTIYLENNSLTGELPAAVADLPNINIYWTKNNNLSGCIPANYTSLCAIQSVQMQNNEQLPSDGDFSQFCDFGLGLDLDADGFCSGIDTDDDCNDNADSAYPGAPEICDGIDNDCDGSIDESFVATNTWIGNDGNWNTSTNWSLGHIPLPCEDVIITNGNITLNINDAVARSITIASSGDLSINGALIIQGSDGNSWISEMGSNADISGSVEIYSLNGTALSISGDINNTGIITINHPEGLIHMEILDDGNWTNSGIGTVNLRVE